MATVIATTLVVRPAHASALSPWALLGTGAAAVAVGEVAVDMSAAIAAAVTVAAAGAAACAKQSCADPLLALIHRHPIIGRRVAAHEMKVYLARHPDAAGPLNVVANQTGLPPPAARQTDQDGLPLARSIPPPPGDCTESQQQQLQADVNDTCKTNAPGRCLAADSPATLQSKADGNRLCYLARAKINRTCFRGGDLGHRIAEIGARAALTRCEDLMGALRTP
ncbi:hypothetical protein HLH33_19095 [Gluconacetobacter diazotrophicus]|uniref:Novel toxin 16 domain-containing protein n=1 Tax=Gluconacetobacter diazotrophicus TaxID=33996 RepID=A0A7W4NII2_GLUDI|nr:hypothetical protein [Gluconacetobacter diazotrophicus]MBB2158369.1 hypothetical protein [Gluconacetobacter diazotrophicus]